MLKASHENILDDDINQDWFQEDEEVAQEDEDMGVIETYSNYKPPKLKVGLPHPVPAVETASLASVESADDL